MLASALNKSDAHNAFSDSFVRAKKIGSQLQRSSSSIYERKEQKMLAVLPTLHIFKKNSKSWKIVIFIVFLHRHYAPKIFKM